MALDQRKLSARQVAGLAKTAGFNAAETPIMTSIAYMESGFDANAVGHNTNGSIDVGLWQINSIHGYSQNDMKDPQKNADAARKVYVSQGFKAWTVYKNGLSDKALKIGIDGTAGIGTQFSIGDIIPDQIEKPFEATTDAIGSIAKTIGDVVSWLSVGANWVRIGYVVVGGALVIKGLGMMGMPVPNAGTVAKVIPMGKVAKSIKKVAA